MSLPFFPLYVDDFDAATMHLSLIEDGIYNRLLRLCWRTPSCTIPNDDKWIKRRLRCDDETYEQHVKPVLEEFFSIASDRLVNKRLQEEYVKASEAHEKRVRAGRKGGQKSKPLKTNATSASNATSKAKAMPKQPEPQPEPQPDLLGDTKVSLVRQDERDRFEDFWAAYPRKVGKGDARKAYERATKKATHEAIANGLISQLDILSKKETNFIPHAATWLNKGRWEDEPQHIGTDKQDIRSGEDTQFRDAVRSAINF